MVLLIIGPSCFGFAAPNAVGLVSKGPLALPTAPQDAQQFPSPDPLQPESGEEGESSSPEAAAKLAKTPATARRRFVPERAAALIAIESPTSRCNLEPGAPAVLTFVVLPLSSRIHLDHQRLLL